MTQSTSVQTSDSDKFKELEKLDTGILQEIANKLERRKILNDLYYLAKEYLGYTDLNIKLHKTVCNELKKISKYKEMVFLLPRGHLKSSLITIAWVIQQILLNQNVRIIILNAILSNAQTFLTDIKAYLSNPRLVALFPDILYAQPDKESPTWTTEQIIVKRTKVVTGPTVMVTGIETSLASKHAEIMVFDDIQDENNSQTLDAIKKVTNKYKSCYSVLEPNGYRVIVGTRYKREDIYGWLEKQGYPFFIRGAFETGSLNTIDAVPIFPEKFSVEILRKIYSEIGSYYFSCQYSNNPLPEESIVFQEKWFKYYEEAAHTFDSIYIIVDPAIALNKKADETVFCVVGKAQGQKLQVLLSDGDKITVQHIVNKLFALYQRYKPITKQIFVAMEVTAYQGALKQWITKEQMEGGRPIFQVIELKPGNRRKEVRIKALQPLFLNEQIELGEHLVKLVRQMLDYPASLHDDHIDALAYLLDLLQAYGGLGASVFLLDLNDNGYHKQKGVPTLEEAILELEEDREGGNNYLDF